MPYSYTPLFGKKWYKRSTKDHAKASQKFWKAAFYARQSSDEHVKQTMLALKNALPNLHDVVREMHQTTHERNEPVSAENVEVWYEKLKEAVAVLNHRLFVVMTAQIKGWTLANELNGLEPGEAPNKNYMIVLNHHLKEQREREERKRLEPQAHWPEMQTAQLAWPSTPYPVQAAPTHWKAHLRCYSCGAFGHFARECQSPALAPPPQPWYMYQQPQR